MDQTSNAGLVFAQLTHDESEDVLRRNHVGRIAYSAHDRVDIQPVNYIYADGWIYGRTAHGTKLDTILQNPWVAFEVDEHEGLYDWRSVIVKGRFEIVPSVTSEGSPTAHIYWRATELLRALASDALTGHDRTPFRLVVFRIHLDEVTGRAARSETVVPVSSPATMAAKAS